MKIAIVGKFNTESLAVHVEQEFIEMGHDIVKINPQVNFLQYKFIGSRLKSIARSFYSNFLDKIPLIRKYTSRSILSQFRYKKIDLTLVLHDYLNSAEVASIKELTNGAVVLWFPDAISNFRLSMFFVADYDFLFFKDKYVVDKLKNELNLNAFYLPQCCNPKVHNKVQFTDSELKEYKCDITNAGNLYPSRSALLKQLKEYDFKLWGATPSTWLDTSEIGHMIMGREVHYEEKIKAFSAAKIVLNNMHMSEINGLNKRAFEIPACGGFQIMSYTEAIEELFEIGKEIVVYYNLQDLKEKIDYYLNPENESERIAIVEKGNLRALTAHTYHKRLSEMLEIIHST